MSAFTDTTLIKKLGDLNSSQQSIQTLSLWLIHHRKHYVTIVKTWAKQIYSVSENRKLILMYLANDVIQTSKRKGPEYGKEFASTLPQIFKHIGESCVTDKLVRNVRRILDIWDERGVYDTTKLDECREAFETAYSNALLKKRKTVSDNGNVTKIVNETVNTENDAKISSNDLKSNLIASLTAIAAIKRSSHPSKQKIKKKRSNSSSRNVKTNIAKSYAKEKTKQSTSNLNNDNDGDSSFVPMGEAPEPEELISVLGSMDYTASSDADVRELIAKLPQEISDSNHIHKLATRQSAIMYLTQVNEAIQIISQYNGRLAAEMEERGKLAIMMRDFQNEQKELLSQAEERLDEYKKKLQKMLTVQRELRDHLSNLPDLSDDSGVLAPLPSPSDLFNVH